ncbi:MAG: hypothetical protein EKK41_05100 [Hyphomicrobiales bacterium]|nr:MAG: hypothetical protein EKK41_05100 [Hyphomicrobiales bacterium]
MDVPEIPEDIQQTATRFAGEYLAHDISCARLYRDVAQLLLSERLAQRERDAKVIAGLVDALKETLEIASRNEAGPYIRRALDALAQGEDA